VRACGVGVRSAVGRAGTEPIPPSDAYREELSRPWDEWRVEGPLDGMSPRAALAVAPRRPPRDCLLDLTGVTSVDSAGVGALLALRRQMLELGARLVVVAPEGPVRRVLEWLGLYECFLTVADAEQGRRLLKTGP